MFIRDVSLVLGSNVLIRAVGLVTSVLIARTLGAEGKGIYAVALLVPTLTVALGELGLGQSVIYQLGQKRLTLEQAIGNLFLIDVVLCAVLVGGALLLAPWLSGNLLRDIDARIVLIAILFIPATLVVNQTGALLRALGRVQAFSVLSFAVGTTQLVALLFVLARWQLSIEPVIGVQLALVTSLAVLGVLWASQDLTERPRANIGRMRPLLSFGLRAHPSYVLVSLEKRFDLLLINVFLAPAAVGLYTVGVSMAQIVWVLTNAMGVVLYPRVAGTSEEEIRRFLPRISRITILMSLLCGVGLAAVGQPLIRALYGEAFDASYLTTVILLPGVLMLSLSRVCEIYLKGVGRPGVVSAVAGLTLAVNLGANLLLIPRFGINGAALASSISYTLGTCVVLVLFLRSSGLRLHEVTVPRPRDVVQLWSLATGMLRGRWRAGESI